ncbi:hypothetical protein Droror1_Dr00027364, partial [Drosera rotundifolia]
ELSRFVANNTQCITSTNCSKKIFFYYGLYWVCRGIFFFISPRELSSSFHRRALRESDGVKAKSYTFWCWVREFRKLSLVAKVRSLGFRSCLLVNWRRAASLESLLRGLRTS